MIHDPIPPRADTSDRAWWGITIALALVPLWMLARVVQAWCEGIL